MPVFVHVVFAWLLAIAVPMQAMAAMTRMHCGPSIHAASLHAGAEHRHDANVSGAMHHHGHGDVVSADQAHSGPDDADANVQGSKVAKPALHKCSACASCCVGAVVASRSFTFEAVQLTDSFDRPLERSVAAFLTSGLERPPRRFLA